VNPLPWFKQDRGESSAAPGLTHSLRRLQLSRLSPVPSTATPGIHLSDLIGGTAVVAGIASLWTAPPRERR
jgi:hypothetical protein